MNTAIIIPAYNEEKHIVSVVRAIKKVSTTYTIIVVSDGSVDATAQLAKKENVIVLEHVINLGKGGAAKTGCDFAYKQKYDAFVLLDADGQHEPKDIPLFLEELKKADIVFGYREKSSDSPFLMNIGNWGLTIMTKLLFGMRIYDTQCGFRAFKKKTYKKIRWTATDYAMESEMIYRARHLRYDQVAIKRIYYDKHKGTTIINGIKIGIQLFRWKLFGG